MCYGLLYIIDPTHYQVTEAFLLISNNIFIFCYYFSKQHSRCQCEFSSPPFLSTEAQLYKQEMKYQNKEIVFKKEKAMLHVISKRCEKTVNYSG